VGQGDPGGQHQSRVSRCPWSPIFHNVRFGDPAFRDAAGAADRIDPGLARAGIALFLALPETAADRVLLCTDLHGDNILAAQRAPWLVIDPKPYVGDPAYDLLQHMLNCEDRLAADPAGLANRMAGLAGADAGRVRQWLFARSVQESVGAPLMRAVAKRLALTSATGS
jgi:streptomycin 6-kinase